MVEKNNNEKITQNNWNKMIEAAYSANDAYDLKDYLEGVIKKNNAEDLKSMLTSTKKSLAAYKGHTSRYANTFLNNTDLPRIQTTNNQNNLELDICYKKLELARREFKQAINNNDSVEEIKYLYEKLIKLRKEYYSMLKKVENKSIKKKQKKELLPSEQLIKRIEEIEQEERKNQKTEESPIEAVYSILELEKQNDNKKAEDFNQTNAIKTNAIEIEITEYFGFSTERNKRHSLLNRKHSIKKIKKSKNNIKRRIIKKTVSLVASLVILATSSIIMTKQSNKINNLDYMPIVINDELTDSTNNSLKIADNQTVLFEVIGQNKEEFINNIVEGQEEIKATKGIEEKDTIEKQVNEAKESLRNAKLKKNKLLKLKEKLKQFMILEEKRKEFIASQNNNIRWFGEQDVILSNKIFKQEMVKQRNLHKI